MIEHKRKNYLPFWDFKLLPCQEQGVHLYYLTTINLSYYIN
jgi:hypothetical protein